MQEVNTYNVNSNLNKLENMSEYEFKTKSMEICKTIIMDQKMLGDMYLARKYNFEERNNKLMDAIEKGHNSEDIDNFSIQTLDSYFELIRQDARREYSQRLLKIILG